jgi:hypothetical protein
MQPLNKERAVCLVALVIGLWGLGTAFSGQGGAGNVPIVPPPSDARDVPSIDIVKVSFLGETFDHYWNTGQEEAARSPWQEPKTTTRSTVVHFPLTEPQLGGFSTIVPVPPHAPTQGRRPMIRQFRPPVSVEDVKPEPGTEDNGE